MFRQLVIICLAGFVSVSGVQHEPPRLYTSTESSGLFSTPAPPLLVSTTQPYLFPDLPHFAVDIHSPGAYSQEHLAQLQGTAFNEYAYVANPVVVNPVPFADLHSQDTAIPLRANFVSSHSHPVAVPAYPHLSSFVNYPSVKYVSTPVTPAKKETVETGQSVTAHSPPAVYLPQEATSTIQTVVKPPEVQLITTPVAEKVESSIVKTAQESVTVGPLSETYVSSTVVPHLIQPVETLAKQPVFKYAPPVKPVLLKPPQATTVSIDARTSVAETPSKPAVIPIQTIVNSPLVRYAPVTPFVNDASSIAHYGPPFIQYSLPPFANKRIPVQVPVEVPVQVPVQVPVKVPVQVPAPKLIQPAPIIINQQVPVTIPQNIPVGVSPQIYSNSIPYLKNNYEFQTPTIYTKPIFEKGYDIANLGATYINTGYPGYTRALKYSYAPAVSRVSFNGLGVRYGY